MLAMEDYYINQNKKIKNTKQALYTKNKETVQKKRIHYATHIELCENQERFLDAKMKLEMDDTMDPNFASQMIGKALEQFKSEENKIRLTSESRSLEVKKSEEEAVLIEEELELMEEEKRKKQKGDTFTLKSKIIEKQRAYHSAEFLIFDNEEKHMIDVKRLEDDESFSTETRAIEIQKVTEDFKANGLKIKSEVDNRRDNIRLAQDELNHFWNFSR